MPGALLSRRVRLFAPLYAALALLALAASAVSGAWAQVQSAQVSIDVPDGKVKTVRLRRLPEGTAMAIVVVASARLRIALVAAKEIKASRPRALFSGAFERKLSFKVTIPETGDYYLMLDNRRGGESVSATVGIRAQRPPAKPPAPTAPKGGGEERTGLPALTT